MAIMEHVNGTQRGRTPPALPEHTFQDSGVTIKIRKVGPMTQQRLSQQIQKEIPEPPIPIVETELGKEPNPADPAYMAAYAAWEHKAAIELNNRMLQLAALEAEVAIDDRARSEIARKKRHMDLAGIAYADDPRLDAAENERVFFVLYVACASPDDLREFGQVVTQRSIPTEEAVQRHVATFPGDV
jgi:hypothetical protein